MLPRSSDWAVALQLWSWETPEDWQEVKNPCMMATYNSPYSLVCSHNHAGWQLTALMALLIGNWQRAAFIALYIGNLQRSCMLAMCSLHSPVCWQPAALMALYVCSPPSPVCWQPTALKAWYVGNLQPS